MPYKDPEKQKAAIAASFRKRYAADKEFRESEAARKAEWQAANRDKANEQARRCREKKRGR